MEFDYDKFRKDIASKRLGLIDGETPLSLRECEKQTGVSHTTLYRMERGSTPDIFTFAILLGWLKQDANRYFK